MYGQNNNSKQCDKDKKRQETPSVILLSLGDVALFDEEVVDFPGLVDVDLDQRPGLGQPQPALPPALVQQGLFVFQVGPRNQPHHLAELPRNITGLVQKPLAFSS